jgi:hypothetical protein
VEKPRGKKSCATFPLSYFFTFWKQKHEICDTNVENKEKLIWYFWYPDPLLIQKSVINSI